MSYSDCLARISQLDSLVRNYDPNWASSGFSMVANDAINGGSLFSGVLESVSGSSATAATANTAQAATRSTVATTSFISPVQGATVSQPFGPTSETL